MRNPKLPRCQTTTYHNPILVSGKPEATRSHSPKNDPRAEVAVSNFDGGWSDENWEDLNVS